MSEQRREHEKALQHISALEEIIDRLKQLGPSEEEGNNALMNVAEWMESLALRTGHARRTRE